MNSVPTGPTDKDGHCDDTDLNSSVASMDVRKHERSAFNETPVKNLAQRPISKPLSALLDAMYHFVLSRS